MRKYAARRSADEWQKLIETQRRSGLTDKAFAEREGINVGTLRWRRSSLSREQSSTGSPETMRLLPVLQVHDDATGGEGHGQAGAVASGSVVLRLPGDVLLEMSEAPSVQWLAQLCIELEIP